MPKRTSKTGSELFIVDNSDKDWKVLGYLHDWCQLSKALDVATGFFEIGSLLALNEEWQKVDQIRILMGDEVSLRTQVMFAQGLTKIKTRLDESLNAEKQANDFLRGVPAIVEAVRSGKIKCRVYREDKFHAKAYITHARLEVVGSAALVGSSNFTYPGLTENIELNVQITGRPVNVLQEWYEERWKKAEDVTEEILHVLERHSKEYSPFDVYARSLHELFRRHAMTDQEWLTAGPENGGSRVYPVLDQYQKDGYHELAEIVDKYEGGFLCDGVGLGKTYIGLMVIESLIVRHRKRVVLFVPKSARESVWENNIRKYLPSLSGPWGNNLLILNHTDLLREKLHREIEAVKEADAIVIDEAHHFRNPGTKEKSRYWRLFEVTEDKELFLLTATPVNNRLIDLQHMIELFSRRQSDYFKDAPLGVHSLPGHFRKMEKALERLVLGRGDGDYGMETNQAEAEKVLLNDALFRALVVQRSREYVKRSQQQHGGVQTQFPDREPPRVINHSIKKTYGRLLEMMEQAFNKEKPLFSLAIYYPLAYYKGSDTSIDPLAEGRQKEVVSLIRTQFLKRFESSVRAFEMSCMTMMIKLLTWVTKHCQTDSEIKRLDRWKTKYSGLIEFVKKRQSDILGAAEEVDEEEDIISQEMLEDMDELPRDEYRVEEIIAESFDDLTQIADFLEETKKFKVSNDDKLQALIRLLKSDPVLKKHKALIFSEYMSTARYIQAELEKAGITGVAEVDSATKTDRGEVIRRFAPYYNGSSSAELAQEGNEETRILISTDVLSEGLNLQDATRLINYDLHWNPVRLMQRIGRVDRRMDPEVERRMLADHPDLKDMRGKIIYWNFLPPDELDELLKLYSKVSHKTLRISKTFGIEGKKLLTPEDDYEALKDFTRSYEGTTTPLEGMHLEYQKLMQDHPDLAESLDRMPQKIFSGKKHPNPDTKAVFFCYTLPAPESNTGDDKGETQWTVEAGETKWYLFDVDSEKIEEEPTRIVDIIRSEKDTPRHCSIPQTTLSEIRAKIEKHIKNTYMRQVQAPAGVKPVLRAWMELS